jgi:hypothetical protein
MSMGKTAMNSKRICFMVPVRRLGDMEIVYKFLPENANAVCSCRLME